MPLFRGASLTLLAGATCAQASAELRLPSAFAGVSDQQARSRALFTAAAKVIVNPRCMNCHPASDRPTQGNNMRPHLPQVTRGTDGGAVPGNTCGGCHMDRNVPIFAGQQTSFQCMPGHPRWGLAPIEMAWEGKSRRNLPPDQGPAAQRRARSRVATRASGARRSRRLGVEAGSRSRPCAQTQERLGELVQAWIDSGAACP